MVGQQWVLLRCRPLDEQNPLGNGYTTAAWSSVDNRGGGYMNTNKDHLVCPWEEYERRKAAIQRQGLSDREYEQAIRRLADELGV